jgi:hypothetical protein
MPSILFQRNLKFMTGAGAAGIQISGATDPDVVATLAAELAAVVGVHTAQVMKDLKAVENWTDLGTTMKANGFGAKAEDGLQVAPLLPICEQARATSLPYGARYSCLSRLHLLLRR